MGATLGARFSPDADLNVQSSQLLRVPSAVLLQLANQLCTDADARAWGCTCSSMMRLLRRYRMKGRIPLIHAAQPHNSRSNLRFGVLCRVLVPDDRYLPYRRQLSLLQQLPPSVTEVEFALRWLGPVDSLALPSSVLSLRMPSHFKHSIAEWKLPLSLTALDFSPGFDQPVDGLQLPASLRKLHFGLLFAQPFSGLKLPAGLLELRLGSSWNRPLNDLPPLPDSLLVLDLGLGFNQPLDAMRRWPPQLRTLGLGHTFNQPLQGVQLPETITELYLRDSFCRTLEGVHLPHSLTSLKIDGQWFRRPLQRVVWPAGLLSLSLPRSWNQPVAGLRLPPSLTGLDFGYSFCQSLREWEPPASLTNFELTDAWKGFEAADLRLPQELKRFSIPERWEVDLADLTLPTGLQSLKLGRKTLIAEPSRVRFPASLTSLNLGECAIPSLAGFVWPPSLTRLCTGSFNAPLLDWTPPALLTQLDLGGGWSLPISQLRLPPNLTHLIFSDAFDQPLDDLQLPASLQVVQIGKRQTVLAASR